MKTSHLFLLGLTPSLVFSQGPLIPPGPPAPSMKTLTQVEPRTDLATIAGDATAMHVIDQPGSYYLSENLDVTTANGIEIEARGVTIDLNGFTISRSSGDPSTGYAIVLNTDLGTRNVFIHNGHIESGVTYDAGGAGDLFTGPGFDYGIAALGTGLPTDTKIECIQIIGVNYEGINLGDHATNSVSDCTVNIAGDTGICAAHISSSTALRCGNIGLRSVGTIIKSHGETVGTDDTDDGIRGHRVIESTGISSGDDGIDATGDITDSTGTSTGVLIPLSGDSPNGIECDGNTKGCSGTSNDGIGIWGCNVIDCTGVSLGINDYDATVRGIRAEGNVANSKGVAAEIGSTIGIWARNGAVQNSKGTGDTGIFASVVTNSQGTGSATGINAFDVHHSKGTSTKVGDGFSKGIDASNIVTHSFGTTTGTGLSSHGIRTNLAIGCLYNPNILVTNQVDCFPK